MFFHIQQKQNQERFQWPEHMHFQKCFFVKTHPTCWQDFFSKQKSWRRFVYHQVTKCLKTYHGAFFWNRSHIPKLPPLGDFWWWQQYSCEKVCQKKIQPPPTLAPTMCLFWRNTRQVGPDDPTQPKTTNSDHGDTNFSWMWRSRLYHSYITKDDRSNRCTSLVKLSNYFIKFQLSVQNTAMMVFFWAFLRPAKPVKPASSKHGKQRMAFRRLVVRAACWMMSTPQYSQCKWHDFPSMEHAAHNDF